MIKLRGGTNPFYALLVVAGVVFVVTACAYGVMAFRQASPRSQPLEADDASLLAVLDRHGVWILGGQVLLLGLLTVGAMGTDSYWDRRQQRTADERGASAASETPPQDANTSPQTANKAEQGEITPQPDVQPKDSNSHESLQSH